MRVTRVLVSLDTRLGFLEEINLEMNGSVHTHPLDYEGIPFCFLHFHALDILVEQFPHALSVKGLSPNTKRGLGSISWPTNQPEGARILVYFAPITMRPLLAINISSAPSAVVMVLSHLEEEVLAP